MFNATDYLFLLPRKVIIFSLVAHNDSVSMSSANNYAYSNSVYVEIHQVHDSNLVDILEEGYQVCG